MLITVVAAGWLLVEDPTGCVKAAEVADALAETAASTLMIELRVTAPGPHAGVRRLSLRVRPVAAAAGEVEAPSRTIEIGAADCSQVPRLIARIADGQLRPLPAPLSAPALPPPSHGAAREHDIADGLPVLSDLDPPSIRTARWRPASLSLSYVRAWETGTFDGAAALHVPLGAETSAGVVVRSGASRPFAGGRVQEGLAMMALGWRREARSIEVGGEARAGILRVRGAGFHGDRADSLPWAEAVVSLGRRLGPARIGFEVAASPFRHRIGLAGADDTIPIAAWRTGIVMGLGIGPEGRTGRRE